MDGTPIDFDDALAGVVNQALKLDGFFPEFKSEHVRGVFPRSELLSLAPRERIMTQGDPSNELYIVCRGTVVIRDEGQEKDLATLAPPATFGEIALLGGEPRNASAFAGTDCVLFKIYSSDMSYLLGSNAPLHEHLRQLALERSRR